MKFIILKKIVDKIIYTSIKDHINWYKTFIFNFSFLPFRQAVRFPVLIYGPCKIATVKGKISFTSPLRTGMLKIGVSDPVRSFYSKSFLSIHGHLKVADGCILRRGIKLHIVENGILDLSKNVFISDNGTVFVSDKVIIGAATRFANDVTLMDSDFHYVINTEKREVRKNHGPIVIGDNNWIGTQTIIKKNTKTPKGTIVTGPYSMLSKDYTTLIPECCIIGGSPAKLIRESYRRINNTNSDKIIWNYFMSTDKPFILDQSVDIDDFCLPENNA